MKVCKTQDILLGQAKAIDHLDKKVALFHTPKGFFACDRICLHKGAELDQGQLNDEWVTCPWHSWQFNVQTGAFKADASMCLNVYRVFVQNDEVYVQFDPS